MIQRMGISLKTTAACQGKCKHCGAKAWMDHDRTWQTELADLERFIDLSVQSNYHYQFIGITGGEPLLWSYLVGGIRMLRESGIADELVLFTNALAVRAKVADIEDVIPHVDRIRVSLYYGNEQEAEMLRRMAPNKVRFLDRRTFWIEPITPHLDALPADCGCKAFGLYGDIVDICPPIRPLFHRLGWDVRQIPQVKLFRPGFLDYLDRIDPFRQLACAYCIGNKNLRDDLEGVKNFVKGKQTNTRLSQITVAL